MATIQLRNKETINVTESSKEIYNKISHAAKNNIPFILVSDHIAANNYLNYHEILKIMDY